jgi:mono/diheme cytochrome c family protein
MTRVILLEQQVKELEAAAEHQAKKKQQSRAQLQHGSVLQVQEAQNLIVAREKANQEADAQYNQQGRQRAPPTCSDCGEKGHKQNQYKIIKNTS